MSEFAPILPVDVADGRVRVVIENVTPYVDGGRFPIKRAGHSDDGASLRNWHLEFARAADDVAALGRSVRSKAGTKPSTANSARWETFAASCGARQSRASRWHWTLRVNVRPINPGVTEHPGWFRKCADGRIQYAENSPKQSQDIYPFDLESDDWRAMWEPLVGVVEFWAGQGVKIFRADNPHTKAVALRGVAIARVRTARPDAICRDDFVLIDFGGEPQRTLEERRTKHSAPRDVAGMPRSFDYARHTALQGTAQAPENPNDSHGWRDNGNGGARGVPADLSPRRRPGRSLPRRQRCRERAAAARV